MNYGEMQNRDVLIKATAIGVSYNRGQRSDDFRSLIYNLLNWSRKENRDEIWPVRGLDFTGYKGEILGIIGSNGSGKTTICKVISGILEPDEGKIVLNGNVTALFSFGLGFNNELTGRENIYTNAMLRGIPAREIPEHIEQIREFSELGDFLDKPIKTYSSGMRARLGFSIAAWIKPEVLILDEALNAGDMAFNRKVSDRMKELVTAAKMVVLVTHSIDYAVKNCDRLIWIDKGEVKAVGVPSEVAAQYRATVPKKGNLLSKNYDLHQTIARVSDRVVVAARNVGITYKGSGGSYQALKNVSFQINEGEVVGIIGHNGAGKSTLCKTITKILAPDSGEIKVDGETTALLGYGIGFNYQLTGRDNILLNGMMLGIEKSRIVSRIDQIIEFSGLHKHIDKPIKQYSSGMIARLGFSIAAMLEPDIFIIDESLTTGDAEFNQKASVKIQELIMQAKAVIVVTHSMNFVEKICTRAIWMKNGEIQYDGDPVEAITRYRNDVERTNRRA